MKTKPRERRDFAGLEKRRKEAVGMFKAGRRQAEVARLLNVSRQSVSRWYKDWQRGGIRAVKAAGRSGRKPRMSPGDLKKIDTALRKGARANGFHTDLWTLRRVAKVIEQITGVHYHQGHVWRILRNSMKGSLQRPAKKAKERNEEAVKVWVSQTWPELEKKPEK
jgi:transposase